MANVISLQFSDQIESLTGRLDYTGNELDNADIDYWLGTEGYTIPYTNIRSSPLNLVVSDTPLNSAWNRNPAADSGTTISSTASWSYPTFSLLPNSISMAIRSGASSGNCQFVLEAENENGSYEVIGTFDQTLSSGFEYHNFKVSPNYWSKSFRFRRTGGISVRIDEIFMYGAFRRENKQSLGLFAANSTVETVKDSQLSIASINGPLDYTGQLSSKRNIIVPTTRILMTGDSTVESKGENLVFSYDPGNSARNLYLPSLPRLDHYVKIINVNGAFPIYLKEQSGGPTLQEISNSSTVLSVECVWEQSDNTWHITA